MSETIRDFNKEAATWDDNPVRAKMARDVSAAIHANTSISGATRVLDFGCGTGLVTFELAALAGSVTGADSSRGMLVVLASKAAAKGFTNVETLLMDPDAGDVLQGEYDLITSSMVFHHIERIAPLLNQFHKCAAPGGSVSIADLDLDDGQFHADNTGVFHPGFDRGIFRRMLEEAGFVDITDVTAAEVEKPAADGGLRRFTIFLISGRKK